MCTGEDRRWSGSSAAAGALGGERDGFCMANERARRGLEPEHPGGRLEAPRQLGLHVVPGARLAQPGEMPVVLRGTGERREPNERVLSLAHRQGGEVVL